MELLFLASGLLLGWSLGANHAANVFGTAVGTRMLKFRTAAVVCAVFVTIGAVFGGQGPSDTLQSLGAVSAIAGSFVVALAAATTVFWMTRLKLPVSTAQAIVGGIIGWNLYTSAVTNPSALAKILTAWLASPLLAAVIAMLLYLLGRSHMRRSRIHLLRLDLYNRIGLLLVGAFGAYSLGANNIANVMGVFVPASVFQDIAVWGRWTLTGSQLLFLLGGLAIAVGVFTYSRNVIATVGHDLLRMSPLAALVVVFSHSLVLFLFSSRTLESWLLSHGLPAIPLVPVSSAQAIIGAVLGIGLVKRWRGFRLRILGEIGLGWLLTPIITCLLTFIALFFMENVFKQPVSAAAATQSSTLGPARPSQLERSFESVTAADICP